MTDKLVAVAVFVTVIVTRLGGTSGADRGCDSEEEKLSQRPESAALEGVVSLRAAAATQAGNNHTRS
eukprot:3057454-Rhodomonas_salina.1